MDSLPRPFTIEIDGKPISKVNGPLDEDTFGGQTCKHAKTGSEPAVFELKECRLISDGLVLSRGMIEDRSLLPKRVLWFKADEHPDPHRVIAHKNGNDYLLQMSGNSFMVNGDTVFSPLLPGQGGHVVVKMQS
ncbi:uncharacterized protein ALTATR162_LOCUS11177 [Alternaria atra]|uniref:Uncharacterized protein n=1 Tax=Alternaria atra TaxID=119953 RepID=A0A8J2IF95_9PLEO|nr:uncharacterized protein ALTATR162_LOCUS11177 [Alternaria atra]CAG5184979.1 unnamed protein product [Alternaria atra]